MALNRSYANENRIITLSSCELQLADTLIQTWWKCPTCNIKNKHYFNKCQACHSTEQMVTCLTSSDTLCKQTSQSVHTYNIRNNVLLRAKKITTDIRAAKQELAVHRCRLKTIEHQSKILQDEIERLTWFFQQSEDRRRIGRLRNVIELSLGEPTFDIIQYTEKQIQDKLLTQTKRYYKNLLSNFFGFVAVNIIMDFLFCKLVLCPF